MPNSPAADTPNDKIAGISITEVRVGTIARRIGNPFDNDPWEWNCEFYPGSHPRECKTGTAKTFERA